jgi:hypothetical protein
MGLCVCDAQISLEETAGRGRVIFRPPITSRVFYLRRGVFVVRRRQVFGAAKKGR